MSHLTYWSCRICSASCDTTQKTKISPHLFFCAHDEPKSISFFYFRRKGFIRTEIFSFVCKSEVVVSTCRVCCWQKYDSHDRHLGLQTKLAPTVAGWKPAQWKGRLGSDSIEIEKIRVERSPIGNQKKGLEAIKVKHNRKPKWFP